jgi:threonine/homoserine/homoserine lactone efflux protein
MENIITFLISNKIVLVIAVIISILIVLSVAKKLLKVALFFLALLVLYAAYLVYTGQKVPRTKQEAVQHVMVKIDEMKSGGQKKTRGRR